MHIDIDRKKMEPLAERMRPRTLDQYIGQEHLVGKDAVLRRMIESGHISSFILWGPPGVGKTTLAQIIAHKLETPFYTLSAVTSGVKDVREVIEKAKSNRFFSANSPILFIDEIHRFSKSQQDSLLGAVEKGIVTLIGATTENPSFEVIRPLLSRCQLYTLKSLEQKDLLALLQRAITEDIELKKLKIKLTETKTLLRYSGGDARKLLNILDLIVSATLEEEKVDITDNLVEERLQQNPLAYDKDGEMHYDIISAFIKSIRGSDPDAAIYWMAQKDLLALLQRAITEDIELKKLKIKLTETKTLLRYSGGDARKLLNILDLIVSATLEEEKVDITDNLVEERLQQNPLAYDKDGEMHYDIISAFIKSIRGSDPDAAIYWMARMIEGGEDPQFIARRLVISAAEDIGLANPNALLIANAAFDAVMKIGWPEGRIPLAEAAIYLATSPKSNSAYLAIDKALAEVRQSGNQLVPLPLRNAPTKLMKELGYHDGYIYPHDYPNNFVPQQYLPDTLTKKRFWYAQHSPIEEKQYQRMLQLWGKRKE